MSRRIDIYWGTVNGYLNPDSSIVEEKWNRLSLLSPGLIIESDDPRIRMACFNLAVENRPRSSVVLRRDLIDVWIELSDSGGPDQRLECLAVELQNVERALRARSYVQSVVFPHGFYEVLR